MNFSNDAFAIVVADDEPSPLAEAAATRSEAFVPQQQPPNKSNKGKCGAKKGGKRTEVSRSVWYQLCKDYDDNHKKVKRKVYLATQKICDQIRDTRSNLSSFCTYLKKYRANTLQDCDAKRVRERKFQVIEDRLVTYVDLQARLHAKDKSEIKWMDLEQKCKLWASEEGLDHFKASPGWISAVLKRNSKIGITLHGEANDVCDEELAQLMGAQAAEQELEVDESESDEDEGTVMNIRNIFEAEAMIGDIVSYCRKRKFKDDVIVSLERAAKKIRNAHIESRANSTAVSTTNFILPQKK